MIICDLCQKVTQSYLKPSYAWDCAPGIKNICKTCYGKINDFEDLLTIKSQKDKENRIRDFVSKMMKKGVKCE
jgi:hypothetical protein